MVTIETFRKMVISLPEVEEKAHFEKPDFRIAKKVFAVLHTGKSAVVVKLSDIDQDVFCSFNKEIFYPVPGGWGKKGWTFINLKTVKKSMLGDALQSAWKTVAPRKLSTHYFPESV